ncbi:thymus-specific serine protease-like [Malaya genurostris]|uniref:thymus-specific serine protease-like n=1 Tax=Malaya genurostris TaxID=325434 RepID=UPI0026F3997D|nr:thymus-specific serine protease-like [Malaya genurostris]
MRTLVLIALVLVTVVAAGVHRQVKPNKKNQRDIFLQLLTRSAAPEQPRKPTASNTPDKAVVVENFFTTQVDHFNLQNTEQWTLRYFSVTDYYKPGGPILIFLAGYRPLYPQMIDEQTLLYEMGREMNGAVYGFETRFYGNSRITEDVSTENLRLLNADQVLADLAEFVTYLRNEVLEDPTARVLVAGAEYGGGLAAWFRIRYPHLGNVAWASSGYMNAIMNFEAFSEAWGETLINHGSPQCYNEIFVAFHVMQNLIDLGRADVLFEKLNICHEIDPENEFQVQYLFFTLMGSIELFTIARKNLDDFASVCEDITSADGDTAVDAFANWFNNRWGDDDDECLVSDPEVTVEKLQNIEWDSLSNLIGGRQALYQECSEFGWFFTTDSPFQPFGDRVNIEFFIEMCRRVFGEWITGETIGRAVDRANNRFGGANPGSSFTHFVNGGADPWRTISITRNLTLDATSVVIPNQLGSADVYATSEDDAPELLEAKRNLKAKLAGYLFPIDPFENP